MHFGMKVIRFWDAIFDGRKAMLHACDILIEKASAEDADDVGNQFGDFSKAYTQCYQKITLFLKQSHHFCYRFEVKQTLYEKISKKEHNPEWLTFPINVVMTNIRDLGREVYQKIYLHGEGRNIWDSYYAPSVNHCIASQGKGPGNVFSRVADTARHVRKMASVIIQSLALQQRMHVFLKKDLPMSVTQSRSILLDVLSDHMVLRGEKATFDYLKRHRAMLEMGKLITPTLRQSDQDALAPFFSEVQEAFNQKGKPSLDLSKHAAVLPPLQSRSQ